MTIDTQRLKETILMICQAGKGILAADESMGTIKKRFDSINLESTEESRRSYRNMLLTADNEEQWISGVILFDETVDQVSADGALFPELIAKKGIAPGIKTDEGKEDHPMWGPQSITRGLKGLGKRLQAYTERSHGALRFTKWRQVILVEPAPSQAFLDYAMHVMAEQAAWSLAAGYVPINEPEVLMDGGHTLEQCQKVTEHALQTLYQKLPEHGVDPSLTILKTNMVLSGKARTKDIPEEVAKATIATFQASVPDVVPGIVFLSGGQTSVQSTENLNACAKRGGEVGIPWFLSFSYGRALQDDALKVWRGLSANVRSGQAAFQKRARLNSLAQQGRYTPAMEKEEVIARSVSG